MKNQAHPLTNDERGQLMRDVTDPREAYNYGWNAGFTAGRNSALQPKPITRAHWEMCTGKDARCGDINIHDPHPVRVEDE